MNLRSMSILFDIKDGRRQQFINSGQSEWLKEKESYPLRMWDLGCLYVLETRLRRASEPGQGDATAERIHEGYVFCMVPQVVTLPRFTKWDLVFGILEEDLVAKVGGMTPHKMKRLWSIGQPFNLVSEAFGTWC